MLFRSRIKEHLCAYDNILSIMIALIQIVTGLYL